MCLRENILLIKCCLEALVSHLTANCCDGVGMGSGGNRFKKITSDTEKISNDTVVSHLHLFKLFIVSPAG